MVAAVVDFALQAFLHAPSVRLGPMLNILLAFSLEGAHAKETARRSPTLPTLTRSENAHRLQAEAEDHQRCHHQGRVDHETSGGMNGLGPISAAGSAGRMGRA